MRIERRLDKHYDKLTSRERFALVLAAEVRGDKAERRRLMDSAREDGFRVPAYRGYLEVFCEVAAQYVIDQLSTSLSRWMLLPLIDDAAEPDPRLVDRHALAPYEFTARRDAWQRLCTEY